MQALPYHAGYDLNSYNTVVKEWSICGNHLEKSFKHWTYSNICGEYLDF